MRIIAVLAAMVIFGFSPALAQSPENGLRFYPAFPTDKNEVMVIITVTTGTPCEKVELQDYKLDGDNLSIDVRIVQPPPDTLCAQVVTQHVLEQNIGKLGRGTYSAQLNINGVPHAKATLYDSTSDVAILSIGKYVDDQGDANLVGEVQNAAGHPVKLVVIGVSFFKDGKLVKEEHIFTTMAVIMPNRTSGFSLGLNDDLQDKEYSASITSFSVEDKPIEKGLSLVVESALDRDGYGVVGGKVLNAADRNATQVKVACAIYDSKGNVIDSIFGYTDSETITPGQTAPFSIFTHSRIAQEFTTSCNTESVELTVEQVRVIPESPTIAAIVAASLAAVIAVNKFRHKV
jgi:hypothetical protein